MKIKNKKVKLPVLISTLIIVSSFVLASSVNKPNYTANMTDEELVREYQKSYWGEHPISKKYLYDVLYVGMPEEEFVSKFTKDLSYEGTARPYIYKKIKNIYYITFPKLPSLRDISLIHRITFKDQKLIKYEYRYIGAPPFMFYVYSDDTNYLVWRGQDIPSIRFSGMLESEFVNKISSDDFFYIIKKQSYRLGNSYIIQGKDGKKWRLKFYPEGGIFSQECLN